MPPILCSPRTGPQRCAFCHDDLSMFDRVTCARCGSCHHRECSRIPARCASCSGALVVRRARASWERFSARRALVVLASGALSMSILLSPALLVSSPAGCGGHLSGALWLKFEERPLFGPRGRGPVDIRGCGPLERGLVPDSEQRVSIAEKRHLPPMGSCAGCPDCGFVEEPADAPLELMGAGCGTSCGLVREDPALRALTGALPERRAPERATSRDSRGTPTRARE